MRFKITKKSLLQISLLILLAVISNFYGATIINNAFYFYHYAFSEKEINIGSCKLSLFDGWALYKHENNIYRFLRLEPGINKLNYFFASFKNEEIGDIAPVELNGFFLIGRYKENDNNMYESMYYFTDYNIRISFANQKTQSNELINLFTQNLECPTLKNLSNG